MTQSRPQQVKIAPPEDDIHGDRKSDDSLGERSKLPLGKCLKIERRTSNTLYKQTFALRIFS